MFKNALISVADKSGLTEFIKPLAEAGMRVVSTGGTAKVLREAGIDVLDVKDQTNYPEVMDGRVKTLHPRIHMALLGREEVTSDSELLQSEGLASFDLVIGNLYAFEQALHQDLSDRELTEYIDIGGPSFLRAAAKNYQQITTICDPADYRTIQTMAELPIEERRRLAAKVFAHVSTYDSMIAHHLGSETSQPDFPLGGKFHRELRYGENPQQNATWYRTPGESNGWQNAEIIQGKELSYNNLLDLEAAIATLREFDPASPATVALKHNNPCGVAVDSDLLSSVDKALKADPVSVFGGIVAINQAVDEKAAARLCELFLECVVAPDYSAAALEIFANKKNLRILKWPDLLTPPASPYVVKTISGGMLVQTVDRVSTEWNNKWEVIGEQPSEQVKADLLLAWKVCAHLKSNAIALASAGKTVGLGMGQVNRVDAVAQSLERMQKFHAGCDSPVLASDAFFPFADSIEVASRKGVRWVIQPGGSVRDDEVIAKAKELGVNLVLTKTRHFWH